MFIKTGLYFLGVSLLQACSACEESNDDQEAASTFLVNNPSPTIPWLYNYYYKSPASLYIPAEASANDELGYTTYSDSGSESGYYSPSPLARTTGPLFAFESCTSPNKEMGICALAGSCSNFGGRASGSCTLGRVCCINTITGCDQTVTVNNTYWSSPITPISSSDSTCTLTVKLDAKLTEQKKSMCQVRLNFGTFSISQPNSESVCSTDTFDVAGANNKVPIICGDNDGQHMYLNVPASDANPTDLQLTFSFGSGGNSPRVWNIQIAMLPCDANYLAPLHCLQYFSSRTGRVLSFNWRDVAGGATRQLANQDYSICFRTPSGSNARLCFSVCTVTTNQRPFSLSVPVVVRNPAPTALRFSQGASTDCNNDYLVIPGGFNSANPPPEANMAFDRFCGERLNALPNLITSTSVCTTATPFHIVYRTNGDETTTTTVDTASNGNRGFCLNFQQ